MTRLINSIRRGVPAGLDETVQLGRTLWHRRADTLALLDHHASSGATEAINSRQEALRRNAVGFRNLTNYRWRSLRDCGNSPQWHTTSLIILVRSTVCSD